MPVIIKHAMLATLLAASVLLPGCATTPDMEETRADDPSLGNECLSLKEQIMLNDDVNNAPEQLGLSPTTDAWLYKEYERLDCDAVITDRRTKKGQL